MFSLSSSEKKLIPGRALKPAEKKPQFDVNNRGSEGD